MHIREVVAEWYYLKDTNDTPLIPFSTQDSDVRDFYFRLASNNLPQLLSGYFGNGGKLQRLIRGCILDFINAHGNSITKQNYDSLARRITANIKGVILKGDSPQFIGLHEVENILLSKIREAVKKAPPKRTKHELVQLQNPITKHWVVVNKTLGSIIKHSRTSKPYKHIKIVAKPSNIDSRGLIG